MSRPRQDQPVHDYISELQSAGPSSPGEWTLSRERALAEAQKRLLAEPRSYVLLLVRAAIQRGAPRVDVHTTSNGLAVHFEGEPFTPSELERLYDAMLSEGGREHRGLRELALAFNGARALRFEKVALQSCDGSTGRVRTAGLGTPERTRDIRRGNAGTSFRVKGTGALPLRKHDVRLERWLLEKHCRYCNVPVYVDDTPISAPAAFDHVTAATVHLQEPGLGGRAGFMPQWSRPPEIRFVMDDVWVATEELELPEPAPGYVALVQVDDLRLDLSEAKVVHDAAHARALSAARQMLAQARQTHDVPVRCAALMTRYEGVQARLQARLEHEHTPRAHFAYSSDAALTTVVVHGPLALAAAGVAKAARWLFRKTSSGRNPSHAARRLLQEFPPHSRDNDLAFVAFKAGEHTRVHQDLRPLMYEMLRATAQE